MRQFEHSVFFLPVLLLGDHQSRLPVRGHERETVSQR
jgi:hypothetical protein